MGTTLWNELMKQKYKKILSLAISETKTGKSRIEMGLKVKRTHHSVCKRRFRRLQSWRLQQHEWGWIVDSGIFKTQIKLWIKIRRKRKRMLARAQCACNIHVGLMWNEVFDRHLVTGYNLSPTVLATYRVSTIDCLPAGATSPRLHELRSITKAVYRVGEKTGPLCYIVSNFGNTAQIYTIFLQKWKWFHS